MPSVFRLKGYRFYFWANEGKPREPVHIHIFKDGAEAKFWLYPNVEPAYNKGFARHELRWMQKVVSERRHEIEESWHGHFG